MRLDEMPSATASVPVLPIASSSPGKLSPTVLVCIVLAFLAPFLFYVDTAKSIVSIWNSSETFAHGYVILPISLWLIWRRRDNFRTMPLRPYRPALGLLLLIGFGWLLARMGEVQVVMQYAFVAMLPAIALAILGRRLSFSLAFPLLFLLLAVPFGEVFIDPLISFTADFTVWALQATGIPVLRNGTRFEIPTGSWSVVEACSGVRYLISSITLGALYAYLTYRSTKRRAIFMLMAVVVPIIANGLRAYMIVMIGHISGMTLAVGVDHLIYGWFFFGLVMFLLFWVGNFWREDQEDTAVTLAAQGVQVAHGAARADAVRGSAAMPASASAVITMALAILVSIAIWPLYALYSDRATFNAAPVRLGTIDFKTAAAQPFTPWVPRYAAADAAFTGTFAQPVVPAADVSERPVGVTILYYRNQRNGKALISSSNRLVGEKDALHQLRSGKRTEAIGGRTLALRESTLQGPTGTMLVWQWYWVGNVFTSNDYAGKLLQAKDKLLLRGDDGAAILLSVPYTRDAEAARVSLRMFLNTNLSAIEAALVTARGT